MTHSSCKTHGIRAKKQLTDDIGEPLILDMAFKPLLLTPQNYIKRTVPIFFEETVLLERFLPEADDAVLGLAGGGGQQVGDGLEDGADGLGRDAFFLGLHSERRDKRGELIYVNHIAKYLLRFCTAKVD